MIKSSFIFTHHKTQEKKNAICAYRILCLKHLIVATCFIDYYQYVSSNKVLHKLFGFKADTLVLC